VRLHIVITLTDRSKYLNMRHLGALGLTNADIYVYLRCEARGWGWKGWGRMGSVSRACHLSCKPAQSAPSQPHPNRPSVPSRTDPGNTRACAISLPCGMRLHERLLLPNLGEEGASFLTHVALVYDNMPDAIMVLHGGKLHTWHAHCR